MRIFLTLFNYKTTKYHDICEFSVFLRTQNSSSESFANSAKQGLLPYHQYFYAPKFVLFENKVIVSPIDNILFVIRSEHFNKKIQLLCFEQDETGSVYVHQGNIYPISSEILRKFFRKLSMDGYPLTYCRGFYFFFIFRKSCICCIKNSFMYFIKKFLQRKPSDEDFQRLFQKFISRFLQKFLQVFYWEIFHALRKNFQEIFQKTIQECSYLNWQSSRDSFKSQLRIPPFYKQS